MAAENVRVRVQVAKNSVLQQMRKQLQACGIMPTTLLCQPNTCMHCGGCNFKERDIPCAVKGELGH